MEIYNRSRQVDGDCVRPIPGRDLGGVLAFLRGFREDAWLACLVYILLLPAFLSITNIILLYFNLADTEHLNYGWNLLVFIGGVAQQVINICHICQICQICQICVKKKSTYNSNQ